MKTLTDEISKKQVYLLTFASSAILWLFVFMIVFPTAWYFSGSALIGFASGIGLPFFLIKKSADKKINVVNRVLEDTYHKTLSSLNKVDYYNYNADGSISIDVSSRLISFIKILPTMEILPPFVFKASEVIEFYYYDPGVTTTKYYGNNIAAAQETLTDNLVAISERNKQRGLHIKIDNVQHPKIVIAMIEKDADHWLLIMKKLIDRTLEETKIPTMIP